MTREAEAIARAECLEVYAAAWTIGLADVGRGTQDQGGRPSFVSVAQFTEDCCPACASWDNTNTHNTPSTWIAASYAELQRRSRVASEAQ